jgi:uncharacterized membrane protein YccC
MPRSPKRGSPMLGSLIALKPRDVPLRVAVRNTLAIVLPLVAGLATGHVAAGLAVSTGALNTMFTDQPGPYRLRLQRMLLAALAAGLAAFVGILVGDSLWPLAIAAFVVSFAGGMLVALGPMAARVGLTSMIVLVLTASMEIPREQAAGVAALICAGGALQALFAIAAWPLQRYRPERFALADVLSQLAATARSRPDAAQQPAVSLAAMEALVLLHGEYRERGEAMRAFRVIAEVCERARIDLLALSDLHARSIEPGARRSIADVLDQAAVVFDALAEGMRDAAPPADADALAASYSLRVRALSDQDVAMADGDLRLARIARERAESLGGQLRSLLRNAPQASSRGEAAAQRADARLPGALRTAAAWPTLRANLGAGSVAFRHALRCATCVAIAAGAERALAIPHGAWIPMTAAIVLKPDFGGTLRFGVLRVAGTLAGLLLASLLAHYAMGDPTLRVLLLAALCIGFRLTATVNYGIGVAFLTGMVVVLLTFRGMSPAESMHARVVGTLAGSALALCAYALWPTWESRRTQAALAAVIDAYRAHLAAVFTGRRGEFAETRAAARRARTNAQASLERLRGEPRGKRSVRQIEHAEAVLANASRLVRAGVALEALQLDGRLLPRETTLDAFAHRTDATLGAISATLAGGTALEAESLRPGERLVAAALASAVAAHDPVALAVADACDRIADSVDTLAHLARPAAPGATAG